MITLEVVNKELDEAFKHLDRQHAQIRWFVQLYVISLGGLFALAGHVLDEPNSGIIGAIIFAGTILVFSLGWFLLSSLAHKMAMIILTHMHISMMRGRRLALADESLKVGYVFPLSARIIGFERVVRNTPYAFFLVNIGILCTGTAFAIYKYTGDGVIAGLVAPWVGMLAGIYYPRSCVTFLKHIYCASKATSLENKIAREKRFELMRASYVRTHRKEVVGVWVALGLFLAVGGLLPLLRGSVTKHSSFLVVLAQVNVVSYGLVRFWYEKRRGPRARSSRPGRRERSKVSD